MTACSDLRFLLGVAFGTVFALAPQAVAGAGRCANRHGMPRPGLDRYDPARQPTQ
jgi:hypothetical protein